MTIAFAGDAIPPYQSGSIYLYQPDQVLRTRLGGNADRLAEYLNALNVTALAVLSAARPELPTSGAIVVAVKPGKRSRVWLSISDGGISKDLRVTLIDRLESIEPMDVYVGPVAVALSFHAWGGAMSRSDKDSVVPIPEEWKNAAKATGGGTLPDSALNFLWPGP